MDDPAARSRKRGRKLPDAARFLRSWAERPLQIGAVHPSGHALTRTMASYVDPALGGPVIEIGPGTGPVTAALLRRGVAPERLVLLEFSSEFCALLRKRHPEARVIEGDAYQISKVLAPLRLAPAAAVISSLPLLTRPVTARLDLLRQCFALMAESAPFVQFTYATMAPIPRQGMNYTAMPSRRIWLNVPPARVWVYRRLVK
jgi:phosphatidylethanolamine/phosphatidyl-N-methylethanolamine N-methyltransferase